jgi:hypothetical protein
MKYIIILAPFFLIGCASTNEDYEYQVHLRDGVGYMHLYTGENKQDAMEYIKFYQKSHGDMKLVKFRK